MKKSMLVLLSITLLAAVLSGCAAGRAMMGATASPSVTFTPEATMTPVVTMAPIVTAQPTDDSLMNDMDPGRTSGVAGGANMPAAGMTPADAGKLAQKIAEAVERISEVDDAEVIVRENRALVAVEFDDQYSAGLDERMEQLITDTVQKVEESITEVSITDDNTLYGQVKSLAERIGKATGFDELADDIGDLWDRVTGR